jgi:hypothetical protein
LVKSPFVFIPSLMGSQPVTRIDNGASKLGNVWRNPAR